MNRQPFDSFTHISFSVDNLDRYYVRTAILNAILQYMPMFKGRLLDMGCGQMPYKKIIMTNEAVSEYIGLDIENALVYNEHVKPDFYWDGEKMPFEKNEFETVFATEVLEHCPCPETTLKECFRVMKPDGLLFFTVPFLWPLHEAPHDEFRYTPFSLARLLKNAGFRKIQINALGGWHASMAQMLGLWVVRSGISGWKKKVLSKVLQPIIRKLIEKDKPPTDYLSGPMVTGLYGIAKK